MQITIDALTKSYGKGTKALQSISLTMGQGMFGLLGPNGAGKSTLMQILATLQPATSGEVTIGNLKLGRDDYEIRRILSYLPSYIVVSARKTHAGQEVRLLSTERPFAWRYDPDIDIGVYKR